MAIITYPLNGIEYLAEDAETYLCTRTSGVFAADGHFVATATGDSRQVSISPGLAWIKNSAYAGKSVLNDGTVILEHDIADGILSRIDRIVLRFDKSANASEIAIKKGTPSSTPVPPSIERSELIYELGLYEISIPVASTVIAQANVKSTILDETVCGIMRDGVTGIPTAHLQEQAMTVIENIAVQFNEFVGEKNDEFYVWFNQLTEILDKNVAANLLNLINQNAADIQGLKDDTKELSDGILGVSNDLQDFKNRTDNPHGVTAAQVGAIPWTDARSADYDMDVIIQQVGNYSWYRVDSSTLGTPYKYGVSGFTHGWILSCVSSTSYGYQIAFLSGAKTPFMRYKQSGTVSDWTTGYLPLHGGTLLGDVIVQKNEYPSVRFDNTGTKSKGYVQHVGNSIYMCVFDNNYSEENVTLCISNRNVYSLANSVRVRDHRNGGSSEYPIFGEHNVTCKSATDYTTNRIRNIQLGIADTPTNSLVNGAVYLKYK